MQYMRAHGNTAGPTQRPTLTGAIAGLISFVPYEGILRMSDARSSIAHGFDISIWTSSAINLAVMITAGILYGAVFKRAANDRQGGWTFGASYGFVLWMVAPITIWQLLAPKPLAVGTAAMGLFVAHVIYGLALGFMFPWIHIMVKARLKNSDHPQVEEYKEDLKSEG